MPGFVDIVAPGMTIQGITADPTITLGQENVIEVMTVRNSEVNGTAICFDDAFFCVANVINILGNGDGGTAILHTGTSAENFVNAESMRGGTRGIINDSTNTAGIFTVDVDQLVCIRTNAIGVTQDSNVAMSINARLVSFEVAGGIGILCLSGVIAPVTNAITTAGGVCFQVDGGNMCAVSCFVVGDIIANPGGFLSVNITTLVGNVISNTGALMEITVVDQTGGTVIEDGEIRGDIQGELFGTYRQRVITVLIATSLAADQQPTMLDTPIQIEFGVAQGSVTDPVMLDVNGTITINEGDLYFVHVKGELGRIGAAAMVAELRLRITLNGVQVGSTLSASIGSSSIVIPLDVTRIIQFSDGDILKLELLRDSSGNNSGGLIQKTTALAGWTDAPTAKITLQRLASG